jgi:hypothetical protein
MDITGNPDDMTEFVESILQNLPISEEQSSQHSQALLSEHLLAFLQLPLNQVRSDTFQVHISS